MQKGSFNTETFNIGKSTFTMRDWVEPTLYNTGETTVYLNGIGIDPGQSFGLGPSGVKMNGIISLNFPEDSPNKSEAKVNYALLEHICH